jgi:hypothetical protein
MVYKSRYHVFLSLKFSKESFSTEDSLYENRLLNVRVPSCTLGINLPRLCQEVGDEYRDPVSNVLVCRVRHDRNEV